MERVGRGIGVVSGVVVFLLFVWKVQVPPGGVYLLMWLQPVLALTAVGISLSRQSKVLYHVASLSFVAMGWFFIMLPLPERLIGLGPLGYVVAAFLIDRVDRST